MNYYNEIKNKLIDNEFIIEYSSDVRIYRTLWQINN